MNRHEKEAFAKTFGIFFIALSLVSGIALFFYDKEQEHHYHQQIFSDMVAYSYALEGTAFNVDFIKPAENEVLAALQVKEGEVYSLFALPDTQIRLKVVMPFDVYQQGIEQQDSKTFMLSALLVVTLLLFSLLFSLYALRPLRDAVGLMEEFLKDIIHDLNTPVTSILLNTQLLRRRHDDVELKRIETSAKTVGSLYKNLEVLNRDLPMRSEQVELVPFFEERVAYYKVLFPALTFSLKGEPVSVAVNRDAFTRIIDNLLSNACKYNVAEGTVEIVFDEKQITIRDTGIGIENTKKVFERFYKESDRGLGLGLNIVKKLARQMGIGVELQSKKGVGTVFILTLPR